MGRVDWTEVLIMCIVAIMALFMIVPTEEE